MAASADDRPKVGLAIILVRDGKVLVGKRKGSHGPGSWSFPGGHLEFGESLQRGVQRELQEEAGLKVRAGSLSFAAVTNDIAYGNHYVTIFMRGDWNPRGGEPIVMEKDKCERWEWVDWDKIPKPHFAGVANLLRSGYSPF